MPKNPHADFSPVLDGYSGIGAFRFWCQTALPLTYDDSLSYYELLNKVVNYLNHTIEDLTAVESNTSALAEAYNQLQKYVNDYFDDLDVEAELRNVLDAMAEDGTLDALLDPLVENQLPGVVDEKIDGVVAEQIDGAVAGQIDESVADQLPALVDAGIPEEVSEWLTENVDPVGSAVVVDSSLTISGAAADAKVTGDEVSDLKTQVVDLQEFTKITKNYTKSVHHSSVITVADTKIDFDASTDNTVYILLTDTAMANGAYVALYYYTENAERVAYGDVYIGTERKIVFPVNIKAVAFYRSGVLSGDVSIKIRVESKNNLKDITDDLLISDDLTNNFTKGGIPLNLSIGDTVNTNPDYSSPALHLIQKCKKYDVFIITGTGGDTPRLWGIVDNDYKLISVASASAMANNKTISIDQDGYFIANVYPDRAYSLAYNHYFGELEYDNLATKEDIIPLENAIENHEFLNYVSDIWKYNAGQSGVGGNLYFPYILKKGDQFVVELVDTDSIIGEDMPFYFILNTDPTSLSRQGSLKANTPTVFVASADIVGVRFYLGSTGIITTTGTFVLKCTLLSDTEQRVISNTTNRFLEIPDYYFEDEYLTAKVEAIKSAIDEIGGNGDAFIFITDEHWDVNQKRSAALINYIDHNIKIPRLFSGGDTKMAGVDEGFCSLLDSSFSGKIYYVVGNHEYINSTTDGAIYRQFNLRGYDEIGNFDRNYYYVDNTQQKIRYIVLNSYSEVPSGGSGADPGYEEEQRSWFANVALNVNAGWTIIIFTHVLYHFSGDYSSLYPASQAINDIILNYNGNGTIACVIQGHSHRDCIHYLGTIPVIITTCDKNTPWKDPGSGVTDINVDRTKGTINEQAFDVMILNKTERQIKAIRIGAKALDGVDTTEGNPVEVRVVNY